MNAGEKQFLVNSGDSEKRTLIRGIQQILLIVLFIGVISCPPAWATNYPVRLDFEELGDENALVDQYTNYGVSFQDLGTNGLQSFVSTMVAPFGNVNTSVAPPCGLTEILVGPDQPAFALNLRHINFAQPQSRVIFGVFHSSLNLPSAYRATIRAFDGTNGTGTELITPIVLLPVTNGVVTIDTGQFNIRSVTIQCRGNYATFDELFFDAGTAPKGGNVVVSSDLDASTPPQFFLDGNPSYLGDSHGVSPANLITLSEGKHVVTLYAPGYEWYQESVEVLLGQNAVLNAVMVPVTVPHFDGESFIQAGGSEIAVGTNASPCLADWDNDGRKDLILGNGNGDIVVCTNAGTDANPVFAAGNPVLTGTNGAASPVMLGFYMDDKNHLVVGYGDGSVKVHYNQGTRTDPDFSGSPYDSTLVTIPTSNAVPFLVDWDNDGRKDLLAGGADGKVYLFLNQRLDASPDYSTATSIVVAVVASFAAPAVVQDWNGDGKKDMVVGDGDGFLNLFLNQGTDAAPVFTNSTRLQTQAGADINVGARARPVVADYNHDHSKDVLIGRGDGRASLYLVPRPRLSITLTATNTIMVSWPSPSTGFSLEQNSDLSTTNWGSTPAPTDNGTNKFILVDPPTDNRFYRLRKP